jgi:hypothetical protein
MSEMTVDNLRFVEIKWLSGERLKLIEFTAAQTVIEIMKTISTLNGKYKVQQFNNGEMVKLHPEDHLILSSKNTIELYLVPISNDPKYVSFDQITELFLHGDFWTLSWLAKYNIYIPTDPSKCLWSTSYDHILQYVNGYLFSNLGSRKYTIDMIKLCMSICYTNIPAVVMLQVGFDEQYVYELYTQNKIKINGLMWYLSDIMHFEYAMKFEKGITLSDRFGTCRKLIARGEFDFAKYLVRDYKQVDYKHVYSIGLYSVLCAINLYKKDITWMDWAVSKFEYDNVIQKLIDDCSTRFDSSVLDILKYIHTKVRSVSKQDMDYTIGLYLKTPSPELFNILEWLIDCVPYTDKLPIDYYIIADKWDLIESKTANIVYPISKSHFTDQTMRYVAMMQIGDCIKIGNILLELGCPWGKVGLLTWARKYGNSDFAKWARSMGCPRNYVG